MPELSPASKAKAFGAFYTDVEVAEFLVRWAVREKSDRVIDPSFGGGVFLEAALKRVEALRGVASQQVYGVELDPPVHSTVSRELSSRYGLNARHLILSDFFDVDPATVPAFDAVVGNPPFVRYQSFGGSGRAKALKRSRAEGVQISRLASSWAPFLVHSAALVRPGGRLAMVVPAEIGHANYAQPVLSYLTRTFRRLALLSFRKPLFPDLSQDTVLLLCEGRGEPFEGLALRDLEGLDSLRDTSLLSGNGLRLDHKALIAGRTRLVSSYLDPRARSLYELLAKAEGTARLGSLADVGIGYVSGANGFFHLSPKEVTEHRLPPDVLVRAVYRGRAFEGVRFTEDDWKRGAADGSAGYTLLIGKDQHVDGATREYIRYGEATEVHKAYKCRVRKPWFSIPNAYLPDAYLTYMNGLRTSLVANDAGAYAPNTLHVVRLKAGRALTGDDLSVSWLSSLTGLSAEIEGHAMGGGMLKLEPREARNVVLPLPAGPLGQLADDADRLLREGRQEAATEIVDVALLQGQLGLSRSDVLLLRQATDELRTRRYFRGRFA